MPLSDLRYQKKRRTVESMIEHLDSFKISPRFITRPWIFNFRDGLIKQTDFALKKRFDMALELVDYGLAGVEIMFSQEATEENLDFFQKFVRGNFLRIASVVVDFSNDASLDFNTLSSPVKKIRNYAIEQLKLALEINEELNTDYTLILLNTEGYETAFGMDITAARDRFAMAIAEALDSVSETRIAFQTTPIRRLKNPLFDTTAELILLCQKIESFLTGSELRERLFAGHSITTVVPDLNFLQHRQEEPVSALSLLLESTRLAGVCYSTFPHAAGCGMNQACIEALDLKSAFYLLKMAAYAESISLVVDSHLIPPQQALKNLMDNFRALITFANYLDDDKIILSQSNPAQNQGWLEAYLLRAASPHVRALPPLEFFQV